MESLDINFIDMEILSVAPSVAGTETKVILTARIADELTPVNFAISKDQAARLFHDIKYVFDNYEIMK